MINKANDKLKELILNKNKYEFNSPFISKVKSFSALFFLEGSVYLSSLKFAKNTNVIASLFNVFNIMLGIVTVNLLLFLFALFAVLFTGTVAFFSWILYDYDRDSQYDKLKKINNFSYKMSDDELMDIYNFIIDSSINNDLKKELSLIILDKNVNGLFWRKVFYLVDTIDFYEKEKNKENDFKKNVSINLEEIEIDKLKSEIENKNKDDVKNIFKI